MYKTQAVITGTQMEEKRYKKTEKRVSMWVRIYSVCVYASVYLFNLADYPKTQLFLINSVCDLVS